MSVKNLSQSFLRDCKLPVACLLGFVTAVIYDTSCDHLQREKAYGTVHSEQIFQQPTNSISAKDHD